MKESTNKGRGLRSILLLVALAAAATLIFFLDEIKRKISAPYEIVAVLPEAHRVQAGTQVWVAGRRIGDVRRTFFMPVTGDTTARIAALLTLPGETRAVLRSDSEVRLTRPTPFGAPVLELLPGTTSGVRLEDGDTLRPRIGGGAREALTTAADLYAALDTLLAETKPLMAKSRARAEDLSALSRSTERVRLELDRLTRDVAGGSLAALNDPTLRASLADTRTELAALRERLAARVAELRSLADTTADGGAARRLALRVDEVTTRLDRVTTLMRTPEGTLGRMQHDSALARALDSLRIQLDTLIAEARRNPLRFVF